MTNWQLILLELGNGCLAYSPRRTSAQRYVLRHRRTPCLNSLPHLVFGLKLKIREFLIWFLRYSLNLQLLEMAGENQLDRSLLALLDENIATASKANEVWFHFLRPTDLFYTFLFLFCSWTTVELDSRFQSLNCQLSLGVDIACVFRLKMWKLLQVQAAQFMEKIRGAVVKYITI